MLSPLPSMKGPAPEPVSTSPHLHEKGQTLTLLSLGTFQIVGLPGGHTTLCAPGQRSACDVSGASKGSVRCGPDLGRQRWAHERSLGSWREGRSPRTEWEPH